jgi:hypothetical protein
LSSETARGSLDQPVGDDRNCCDAEPGNQAASRVGLGQSDVNFLAEVARSDQRGDDEHGEREHHRLIDAEENDGGRKREADFGQELAGRASGRRAGLVERGLNVANTVRRLAHGRSQGVEDDSDHGGEIADPEQHDRGYKVNEARQCLQRVDGGFENAPGAIGKAA